MENKYQCQYRNSRTKRRCKEYAESYLGLPTGEFIGVCGKHFQSMKRLYESKYGAENVRQQTRLVE